jgi:hypothetical protein
MLRSPQAAVHAVSLYSGVRLISIMQRIAAILAIGGALILISWVTSPAALPAAAEPRVSPAELDRAEQTAQAVAPLTTEINDQAARLRARLAQPPPPPAPERNPFRFGGTSPSRTGTYPAKKGTVPGARGYVPPAPASLALPVLVAITSDARDGGLMRTAALSMGDDMKIVTPGQVFDRFMVESIGSDSVRIVDITSPTRAVFIVAIR